jgi:hypothetical protein
MGDALSQTTEDYQKKEMTRQAIEAMTDHLHGHLTTLPVPQGIAFELNIPTDIVGAPKPKFDLPASASSTLH